MTKIATTSDIHGVIPILPTPFHTDESLDETGYESILNFAKQAGCKTIGLPAFGSEFYKLSTVERSIILKTVFDQANGLNVIVQCNHTSPKVIEAMVEEAEKLGATAINTALPRAMPASEEQLLKHASTVCASTSLPVVIQDYNPGGPIIGLDFAVKLSNKFENFKFIKYEIPGIGPLVRKILEATNGKVKVISGWGGSYMLEQVPAGIAGIMPGIPLADFFVKIWDKASNGKRKEAMMMFSSISSYLSFSLQNMEMFHHAEKRLAVRRGIMKSDVVRSVSIDLDLYQDKYLELVLDETCAALEQYGLKSNIL
jgi:4-hydroxy-tetrahydrodipicolinate synthase